MNNFTSIFSQILWLFMRLDFEKAVDETKAEYKANGFTLLGGNLCHCFSVNEEGHILLEK